MVGLPPLPPPELTPDEFARALDAVEALVAASQNKLEKIIAGTAEAYNSAWTRHTAALRTQKRQHLSDTLLKQAIATAIVGGLGGLAAHVMKVKIGLDDKVSAGQAMVIDGSKDLGKTMMKKGLAAPINVDALSVFPPDPVAFLTRSIGAAATEAQVLLNTVYQWRTALEEGSLRDRAFNPHALYLATLTVAGTPVLEVAAPNIQQEARSFELAFWRTWLENYAYTVSTRYSMLDGHRVSNDPFAPQVAVDVEENWGDEIVRAINDLGEDGRGWVEKFGGVSEERAQAQKDRLDHQLETGIIDA
jgi:hypothetical protein